MTYGHWRPAYVGAGSNLASPAEQVTTAMRSIDELPDTIVIRHSSFYRSGPMGPADQPDFINAVLSLVTQLDPIELLSGLQRIEDAHARDRNVERWGPRTLDLDILAYSNLSTRDDRLTLPHPGIPDRNFVLLPWQEISPHYYVPGLATVAELAAQAPAEPEIERLSQ